MQFVTSVLEIEMRYNIKMVTVRRVKYIFLKSTFDCQSSKDQQVVRYSFRMFSQYWSLIVGLRCFIRY